MWYEVMDRVTGLEKRLAALPHVFTLHGGRRGNDYLSVAKRFLAWHAGLMVS